MELSELSLRVEKLEEIIQELAKWTNFKNFNLNRNEEGSLENSGKTTHQNKKKGNKKGPSRFPVAEEPTPENSGEEDAEDPMSSVIIKMEFEEEDEEPLESGQFDEDSSENVGWNDCLSTDEDPRLIPFDGGEHSESAFEFDGAGSIEPEEPPKKRRKPSVKKKVKAKVPQKSLSEPFVSLLRPLTRSHSQLLKKIKRKQRSRRMQCPLCQCTFKSQISLERHRQQHHDAGYNCGICDFEGDNYDSLRDHLMSHKTEDGETLQCPHCPKTCKTWANLSTHLRTHTEEKPWKCEKCSNSYREEKHLKMHEKYCKNKVNLGDRPFACPHCPYAAATKQTLSYHTRALHPATEEERLHRPFNCPECPKTFKQKYQMQRHVRHIHNTDGKTFLCDSCPYLASNYVNLQQHIKNNHEEPSFFCYFCSWKGRKLDALIIHLRKHTGEKPYKCPHCIYASTASNSVNNHVRNIHGKGKEQGSFQCDKCPSKFKSPNHLAKHLKMHDGSAYNCGICGFEGFNDSSLRDHLDCHKNEDGMFQCPQCRKSSKRSLDLIRHIRTHTREKPYKCGNCEYASTRKDNVKQHEMTCKGNQEKPKDLNDGEELPEHNATSATATTTTSAQDEGNYWNELNPFKY